MSKILTDSSNYPAIAEAIRAKGVEGTFKPSEMPAAIASIVAGGGGDYTFDPPHIELIGQNAFYTKYVLSNGGGTIFYNVETRVPDPNFEKITLYWSIGGNTNPNNGASIAGIEIGYRAPGAVTDTALFSWKLSLISGEQVREIDCSEVPEGSEYYFWWADGGTYVDSYVQFYAYCKDDREITFETTRNKSVSSATTSWNPKEFTQDVRFIGEKEYYQGSLSIGDDLIIKTAEGGMY